MNSDASNNGWGAGLCDLCPGNESAVAVKECNASGTPVTCADGYFLESGTTPKCTACSANCL